MGDIAIRVEGLSKQYHIGGKQERYKTLRDTLAHVFISPVRRAGKLMRGQAASKLNGTVWALRDVSFEVKQGEVVGIIGRNGAGKSTLLKILSQITEPTTGYADIYGRIGSLLEVGTGFHPELTGRENIYLNGAILGMKRTEIDRKFDEIVDFAEVEKFIDTPVKHYSTGMYLRLAFAVAAHLEPEILLVDEVLAVGDAAFQKKCLGKMEDVSKEGRTVLFVSHNMGAVENLCKSAMWVNEGKVVTYGNTSTTISSYLKSNMYVCSVNLEECKRRGTGEARVTGVRLLNSDGNKCDSFIMGETIVIEFDVDFFGSFRSVRFSVDIKRADIELPVLHLHSSDSSFALEQVFSGKRSFHVEMPECLLYPNFYRISLWVGAPEKELDYVSDVLNFSVVQSGISARTTPFHPHLGVFHQSSIWQETKMDK